MNLGVRAHDFKADNIEELAKKVSTQGIKNVQLALAKSFPDINSDAGNLSPGFGHHIGNTLAKHDVQIAVLSCYFNMVDPDETSRQKSIRKFKEYVRYAPAFGARIVGSETGSYNRDMTFHTDNHGEKAFQKVKETISELASEAEKFGTIIGVENSVTLTVNTPERMKRLLDEVDSPNVQVLYDPIGFISAEAYQQQNETLEKSLDILADRIAAVHIKDFVIKNGERVIVPPGKGLLNIELVFRFLKKHKPFIEIILEECPEASIPETVSYLKALYERV